MADYIIDRWQFLQSWTRLKTNDTILVKAEGTMDNVTIPHDVASVTLEEGAYLTEGLKTGKELTIKELTELVAKVIGYEGKIEWDTTKPNGTPRKLLDVSKATALGWTYKTELEDGIRLSYQDFLTNPMRAER